MMIAPNDRTGILYGELDVSLFFLMTAHQFIIPCIVKKNDPVLLGCQPTRRLQLLSSCSTTSEHHMFYVVFKL